MLQLKVAVVGGGISGLAATHRLHELAPDVRVSLLEAGERVGGVLQTTQRDGYLTEAAADGFLADPPYAVDLCRRLGLENELVYPAEAQRQAFVLNRGKLQPVPEGFVVMAPGKLAPLLATPILSVIGKLRAALEYFLPNRATDQDESLQSFVSRRFGKELFERLVQPLVGGIYTADPARLSVDATMPRFRQWEREYGSLINAMLHERRRTQRGARAKRYGQFATLRGGMSTLVTAIANRLPAGCIKVDSPVEAILPVEGGKWRLVIGGGRPRIVTVDGLVLAAPAQRLAGMLQTVDPELTHLLRDVEYASCAVACFGYQRQQIGNPLRGFGFVVPLVEQRTILSCSFASVKYAGRAPTDSVLLRVFVGGALQSGLLRFSRQQILELAEREIAQLLNIRGGPQYTQLIRQQRAMPQYHVGHLGRVRKIEVRLQHLPTLALAGSSLYGVGVPSCINSGESAAKHVIQRLIRHASDKQTFAETFSEGVLSCHDTTR
jgi:oxygen-dependent protoporphyrinogen oxidase